MENERILRDAAGWCARLGAPDCSERDRATFQDWLQRDRSHAAAYAAVERLLGKVDRIVSEDIRLHVLAERAYAAGRTEATPRRTGWRRMAVPIGLAASLIIALVSVRSTPESSHIAVPEATYATVSGERRSITLEDGSLVHLDVSTRLNVRMSRTERKIELLAGRALFDVARDVNRPFTVEAANGRVTALGTRFQVHREGQQVIVTLAEGSVAVSDTSAAGRNEQRLRPGEQIRYGSDPASWKRSTVDPQIVTSWSRGRHVFRNTPITEALEEVNRYATRKVRLGDPNLAELTVSGNFIVGNSELIVAALAAVLPLRVDEGGGNEIVLFSRYELGSSDPVR